ncbi:uncharacterized protein LOC117331778 [Pecten maximus]|uniref:uncharacterized protein LOC117331778 n=1 Tax=Pecten maximus TaxID=6579 RepID=UPI001458AF70|nr:uncharacterized protein LOC117331778 [Pecten maximus]
MDRQDVAKIRAHMDYIIENLDVTDFETELVGNGLTLNTINEIDKLEPGRDKNKKCLEFIMKSKNGSFKTLIDLLKKHHYVEAANKLESGLPPEAASEEAKVCAQSIHVPDKKRNIRPTQKDLAHLSGTVSPKGKIAWSTCLGISQYDRDHIEVDNQDGPTQMMKILFRWKTKLGSAATLGVLMDKYNDALDIGVRIDTEKLKEIIDDIK